MFHKLNCAGGRLGLGENWPRDRWGGGPWCHWPSRSSGSSWSSCPSWPGGKLAEVGRERWTLMPLRGFVQLNVGRSQWGDANQCCAMHNAQCKPLLYNNAQCLQSSAAQLTLLCFAQFNAMQRPTLYFFVAKQIKDWRALQLQLHYTQYFFTMFCTIQCNATAYISLSQPKHKKEHPSLLIPYSLSPSGTFSIHKKFPFIGMPENVQ